MGQVGTTRPEPRDRRQRLFQVEVGWMPLGPQGVDDERVESFQKRPAFVGDRADIGAIGEVADPKPGDLEPAVVEPDRHDALAEDGEADAGGDPLEPELRQAAGRHLGGVFGEGVGKYLADGGLGVVLAIDRHRAADHLGEDPGVVEPEQVVGVLVGERDRVDLHHPFADQLQPHLGRRVDQEIPARQVHQDAAPRSLVPGVVRPAHGAIAADHRHARRRPAAQDGQPPSPVRHHHHDAVSSDFPNKFHCTRSRPRGRPGLPSTIFWVFPTFLDEAAIAPIGLGEADYRVSSDHTCSRPLRGRKLVGKLAMRWSWVRFVGRPSDVRRRWVRSARSW